MLGLAVSVTGGRECGKVCELHLQRNSRRSRPGLNSQITDEFLETCPQAVGVGGNEEVM